MILIWSFLVLVFWLLAYEAWALLTHHPTISDQVRDLQRRWTFLAFVIGFVSGGLIFGLGVHFFWIWCQ